MSLVAASSVDNIVFHLEIILREANPAITPQLVASQEGIFVKYADYKEREHIEKVSEVLKNSS